MTSLQSEQIKSESTTLNDLKHRIKRTIWQASLAEKQVYPDIEVLDQTCLPHQVRSVRLSSLDDACRAIATMIVRGAPLIGATTAYGMALAMRDDSSDDMIHQAAQALFKTRPTAVNLQWALNQMKPTLLSLPTQERVEWAYQKASEICDDDVAMCSAIGEHGLTLFREAYQAKVDAGKEGPLNVLTHCNAGWLGTIEWGTATSPIYKAHQAGIPIHVWVDETRPRNQGAHLTAWELAFHGVPHTLIVDNAGGHLMQHGQVDVCIVGSDRTTANGDVCNKIGTYLKALAAFDNQLPFYVALPSSTLDFTLKSGKDIPIEERAEHEVTHMRGRTSEGELIDVRIAPQGCKAVNLGFDVTPARYVTRLITERGICPASTEGLASLFPKDHPKEE